MRFIRGGVAVAALVLAACGEDEVAPRGPVTVRFATPTYPKTGGGRDTAFAQVTMDGQITVTAPTESLTNVPRGTHVFVAYLDNEYLGQSIPVTLNPRGNRVVLPLAAAPSCRLYPNDARFCAGRNYIYKTAHRLYCPAGDFGEFCAYNPAADQLGATWPADNLQTQGNEYIAHAKLLIAARVGSASGPPAAMALYDAGDYLPRVIHHADRTDSSYWQAAVWTDGRHVPIYPESTPAITDRVGVVFGLQVKQTYFVPADAKDVVFVRFDVTNVSDSADWRKLHPDVPAAGQTLYNIWLAPMIDADVGGIRTVGTNTIDDRIDDNGTVFPADSLVVAYDQEFSTPVMGGGYATRPGLVGVRVLTGPPGAKALILDAGTTLRWRTAAEEAATYAVLAGGRDGAAAGCTNYSEALVCAQTVNSEEEHDVRVGWSIGPIASLAPGQTVSLQIAIMVAAPTLGSFTSGTSVPPVNNDLNSTTRNIYDIAAPLRALSNSIKLIRVSGTTF